MSSRERSECAQAGDSEGGALDLIHYGRGHWYARSGQKWKDFSATSTSIAFFAGVPIERDSLLWAALRLQAIAEELLSYCGENDEIS